MNWWWGHDEIPSKPPRPVPTNAISEMIGEDDRGGVPGRAAGWAWRGELQHARPWTDQHETKNIARKNAGTVYKLPASWYYLLQRREILFVAALRASRPSALRGTTARTPPGNLRFSARVLRSGDCLDSGYGSFAVESALDLPACNQASPEGAFARGNPGSQHRLDAILNAKKEK